MKYVLIISLIALIGVGYIYKDSIKAGPLASKELKGQKKKDKQGDNNSTTQVEVKKHWALPGKLREISGLSYLDAERFACVQDEEGIMFIYNTNNQEIEKEISFASVGDYEGITLVGNNAYVVRSDGTLFEITNWNTKAVVKQYATGLSAAHNVEGLFYDKTHNRLLLAIKGKEPTTSAYKGIYAFDLASKSFNNTPVYKIDMSSDVGNGSGKKKKGFSPSAIARHPTSNELYIVDGPGAKLMVMDAQGSVKQVYNLGNSFEQAEGITFSPEGDMFISNEGVKEAGNIMHVTII